MINRLTGWSVVADGEIGSDASARSDVPKPTHSAITRIAAHTGSIPPHNLTEMAPLVQGICIRFAAIVGVVVDLAIVEAAGDDRTHLHREVAGTYVLAVTGLWVASGIRWAVGLAVTELVSYITRRGGKRHTCCEHRRNHQRSS